MNDVITIEHSLKFYVYKYNIWKWYIARRAEHHFGLEGCKL
jgi:hypothetical protein